MELVKYGKAWIVTTLAVRALGAVTLAGLAAGLFLGDGGTLSITWQPGG